MKKPYPNSGSWGSFWSQGFFSTVLIATDLYHTPLKVSTGTAQAHHRALCGWLPPGAPMALPRTYQSPPSGSLSSTAPSAPCSLQLLHTAPLLCNPGRLPEPSGSVLPHFKEKENNTYWSYCCKKHSAQQIRRQSRASWDCRATTQSRKTVKP